MTLEQRLAQFETEKEQTAIHFHRIEGAVMVLKQMINEQAELMPDSVEAGVEKPVSETGEVS